MFVEGRVHQEIPIECDHRIVILKQAHKQRVVLTASTLCAQSKYSSDITYELISDDCELRPFIALGVFKLSFDLNRSEELLQIKVLPSPEAKILGNQISPSDVRDNGLELGLGIAVPDTSQKIKIKEPIRQWSPARGSVWIPLRKFLPVRCSST
jgi:hypothetical protein